MKRLICLLAVFCLVLPMAVVPATAADTLPESLTAHEPYTCDSADGSPRMVQEYSFDVPGTNQYSLLTPTVTLRAGQTVTVSGFWTPVYSTLWIRLEKVGGTQSDRAMTLNENEPITFDVLYTGSYRMWVSADTYASSGAIRVSW